MYLIIFNILFILINYIIFTYFLLYSYAFVFLINAQKATRISILFFLKRN